MKYGLEHLFGDILKIINILIILCLIFIPLGIWKAVELIIWLFNTIAPTP